MKEDYREEISDCQKGYKCGFCVRRFNEIHAPGKSDSGAFFVSDRDRVR